MNRVVVTGIGMVTPLAYKTNDTWQRLIEGKSGINKIMSFDTDDLNVKIAGQIPSPDEEFGFNPDNHLEKKDQVLFFLNRRGFSPHVLCKKCLNAFTCPNCSINLVYHKNKTLFYVITVVLNLRSIEIAPKKENVNLSLVAQG